MKVDKEELNATNANKRNAGFYKNKKNKNKNQNQNQKNQLQPSEAPLSPEYVVVSPQKQVSPQKK